MAKNTIPLDDDDASLPLPGDDMRLDRAIDDLRGILKADSGDAADDLAAASDDLGSFGDFGDPLAGAESLGDDFSFGEESKPEQPLGSALSDNYEMIMDIPIDVQIVLGSSRMQVAALMNLEKGAVIALDKKIGEPVEIVVSGRTIARGEITVLDDDDTRFGVKLIDVVGKAKS